MTSVWQFDNLTVSSVADETVKCSQQRQSLMLLLTVAKPDSLSTVPSSLHWNWVISEAGSQTKTK